MANLQVLVEFNGLHPTGGGIDLNVGGGGRGFAGTFDVAVTTDDTGKFTVTAPPLPEGLPAGPGRGGRPGRPAAAARLLVGSEHAFRIDKTAPDHRRSFTPGGPLRRITQPSTSFNSLTLDAVDHVRDAVDP